MAREVSWEGSREEIATGRTRLIEGNINHNKVQCILSLIL